MTTSLKDVSSAQMIRSLSELGCFEHENSAFGCAYLDRGKVYYRLGSEWGRVNNFIKGCPLKGLYPTPMLEKTVRQATLSGTEEDAKLQVKLQVGRQLQSMYNKTYFDIMAKLSQCAPNDSSGELLEVYREEIDGFFDADQLQMFEGLMGMAYQAKLLTDDHLHSLQSWLSNVRMQMADDMIIKHGFNRTFYAYVQLDQQGNVRRIINANEKSLMGQKQISERQGFLLSPVFSKTCWYVKAAELNQVRLAFQDSLNQLMDEHYLSRIKALRQLPPAIEPALYEQCLAQAENACSNEAVEALVDYGRLWNMASKVK